MRITRLLLLPLIAFVLCLPSVAARNHERDPLTDQETDQLRDVADDPAHKIALYQKFIAARVQNLDHLRAGAHAQDRGSRIHDALEDFVSLSDEVADNVDEGAARYADLRKTLTDLIAANSDWQKSLEALKAGAPAAELKEYEFVLTDAFDAAKANADSFAAILEKQKVDIPRLQKEAKEREKRRRERE